MLFSPFKKSNWGVLLCPALPERARRGIPRRCSPSWEISAVRGDGGKPFGSQFGLGMVVGFPVPLLARSFGGRRACAFSGGISSGGGINRKSDFPREHFAGQDVAVSRHINLPQSIRGFGGIFLHGNRPKIRASNAIPLFVATTPLGDSGCGKKMMKIC